MELMRLSKYLSQKGFCSRREAEGLIDLGQIKVNGIVVTAQGTKIHPNDTVELLSRAQKILESKVTILLHKPLGYVSNLPEKGYLPAIDLITAENQIKKPNEPAFVLSMKKKLAVAGRLDIDSKGLLVLTQDGTVAKKLVSSGLEKEYLVRVLGEVAPLMLSKLSFGLSLDGQPLKKARIALLEPGLLKFILTEGKKRQIRRMCELVGLKVVGLKRVRIGKIVLGDLPVGKWRFLKPHEAF
ncbi:MAG: pseudouridine synthase [Parachlamydiales bacterium]